MDMIIKRLSEASTWAGLGAFLVGVGIVGPDLWDQLQGTILKVVAALGAVAGVAAAAIPEKGQ